MSNNNKTFLTSVEEKYEDENAFYDNSDNEDNYSDEDNIIIIRTLLAKLKRLLKIHELIDEKGNIDEAISSLKPPIFWKDKPVVTQQLKAWGKRELKDLIYTSNDIELLIKKNSTIGKNILSDFIINNSKKINN